MALLSADDVLNKRFQPTKFREGYDQDEVDDFLDEIVNTLRAVYTENDELKAKLQAAEARVGELTRNGGEQTVAPAAEEAPVAAAAPIVAPEQPGEATGMLVLAQRLHDEYVANGRDEAERIINEAKAEGSQIVKDAEDIRVETLRKLETERSDIQRKIDELRTFENEYRSRLRGYLEGLLGDIKLADA